MTRTGFQAIGAAGVAAAAVGVALWFEGAGAAGAGAALPAIAAGGLAWWQAGRMWDQEYGAKK